MGGIKEHSLILIHERDPRSRGKEILYYIMRRKLEKGNLVGYFNISYPIHLLIIVLEKLGIPTKRYLEGQTLAIVDTFGSFYDISMPSRGIWYLSGSLSSDVLPNKYAEVVEAHKKKWAELNLFEGRKLFGFAIDISSYLELLGGEKETLKYLELSAEIRSKSRAYRKYPTGTNFWLWSGDRGKNVLASTYRRADYVLRTSSEIKNGEIVRRLEIIKSRVPQNEILTFRYHFENGVPILDAED
nr:hypothetical protein [Thermococcus sp. 21S7]